MSTTPSDRPRFATGGVVNGNPSTALPHTGCRLFLPRHSRDHNERIRQILNQVRNA